MCSRSFWVGTHQCGDREYCSNDSDKQSKLKSLRCGQNSISLRFVFVQHAWGTSRVKLKQGAFLSEKSGPLDFQQDLPRIFDVLRKPPLILPMPGHSCQ